MKELILKIMDQIDTEMREQGCYLEIDELWELAEEAFLTGEYDA